MNVTEPIIANVTDPNAIIDDVTNGGSSIIDDLTKQGNDLLNGAKNFGGLLQLPNEYDNVPESFYEISATNIDGELVSMSQYAGKLLIVVNVASC